MAVEAAGTEERRIEDVGPVGRGEDDDALVGVEAVHLDEDLVERLLALVVAAAEAGAAVPPHGVDLVDEDDAGRVLLGLLEHVADARGAHAHEHLDEVRARDREERHVRLARDRPGQEGLARAGRADEEDALGDLPAEPLELLGILEELDDLLELDLRFLDARDVLEGHLLLRRGQELGAGLPEGEGLVPAGLHLPHDHEPDRHQEDQGAIHHQGRDEGGILLRRDVDLDVLGAEILDHVGVVPGVGLEERLALPGGRRVLAADLFAADLYFLHVTLAHLIEELRERHFFDGGRAGLEDVPREDDEDQDHHPEKQVFDGGVQRVRLLTGLPCTEYRIHGGEARGPGRPA